MGEATAAYPDGLERTVQTRDGVSVLLRPIRPDDSDALVAFHASASPDTIYRRFFSAHPRLGAAEIDRFTHLDYLDRFAIVAERGGELIGVSRYERVPGTEEAEVAFVVTDAYQHRGLATSFLEMLAEVAWARGIRAFVAETLADNHDMLEVFSGSGFDVTIQWKEDVAEVRFSITPTERYRAAVAARHKGVGGSC
jgi:RimJ/RimL family protein N-acetyltransferase